MTRRSRSHTLTVAGVTHTVEVATDGTLTVDGRSGPISVVRLDPSTFCVTIDGRQRPVFLAIEGTRGWAFADGHVFQFDLEPERRTLAGPADPPSRLAAPMPARVLSVLVEPGHAVRRGDPLILLEAMKMELTLSAPRDARIETIACAAGDLVQPGMPLVTLTDDAPARGA